MKAKLEVYRTRSLRRSQRWAWRLVASNGRTIATSGEGYANRLDAVVLAAQVVDGDYAWRYDLVMP